MPNLDTHLSARIADATRRSPALTHLARFGASYLVWLLLVAAYAFSCFGNPVDPPVSLIQRLTFVTLAAWIVTLGLEYLFRRPRPFEAGGQEPLIRMTFKTPSFPSGHATVSFAIASAMYFLDAGLFPWFLAAAVLVSLSRVAVGVHYVSDIVVGALIGSMVPWGLLYLAFFVFH